MTGRGLASGVDLDWDELILLAVPVLLLLAVGVVIGWIARGWVP